MKKGDLVNFFSAVAAYRKNYTHRNPGLVIAAESSKESNLAQDKGSAYVMWNNGEITCEHLTYLKIIK